MNNATLLESTNNKKIEKILKHRMLSHITGVARRFLAFWDCNNMGDLLRYSEPPTGVPFVVAVVEVVPLLAERGHAQCLHQLHTLVAVKVADP